jgi:hypothetical protein
MDKSWSLRTAVGVIGALVLISNNGCTDIFYPYNLVGSWDGECTVEGRIDGWYDWIDVDVEFDMDVSIRLDDQGRIRGDADAACWGAEGAGGGADCGDFDLDLEGDRSKGWVELTLDGQNEWNDEIVLKLDGTIYQDVVEGDCTLLNWADEPYDGDFKLRR